MRLIWYLVPMFFIESKHNLGWKELVEVIWSDPLLKTGLASVLDQVAQDLIQLRFKYLQG